MSRARRRRGREPAGEGPTRSGGAPERREEHPDGVWVVRPVRGSSSVKTYRCPGCDQAIPPVTPHVVCWREGDPEDRRHWHTPCWAARDRRGPRPPRGRPPRH